MVTLSLLSGGLALLCWPDTTPLARLRAMTATRTRRLRTPRPSAMTLSGGAALAGWLAADVAGALAAALAAATTWRRFRARAEVRHTLAAADGLTEALRSLVAALRAGAHPAEAADSAATDAEPRAATAMRAMAAAARLNGDVARALDTVSTPALAAPLTRLAKAWQLAQRHGLPLAEVLEAVRADLDQRTTFARQVTARMAGPRSSAAVLAVLPTLGIALGEAMGARPLHVLTATGHGQLMLLSGVALLCAGITWCGHLTNQVVLR